MAARKPKSTRWEIIRLGKKGIVLGIVSAATAEDAHAAAVIEYKIDQRKTSLLVRPV